MLFLLINRKKLLICKCSDGTLIVSPECLSIHDVVRIASIVIDNTILLASFPGLRTAFVARAWERGYDPAAAALPLA